MPRDIHAFSFYSDDKHSIVDPKRYEVYQKAAAPFREVTKAAEDAADTFQANGSTAAARCVLHILSVAADDQAMTGNMDSNQSYYVQNWTLGALAITFLKVRSSNAGSADERKKIVGWMSRVAHATESYFNQRRAKKTKDSQNNHLYWAGMTVMAVGVAADDRQFYDWGVGAYQDGAGQVAPDGTLPLEMERGARALHYHLFAAAPLVMMAEFGAANDQDLYAAHQGALHLLVRRAISGLQDNSYFKQKAGVEQDTPGAKPKPTDIVWLRPYARRFPNPQYTSMLKGVASVPYEYLGGVLPE
jgi:poly(beta-D-mannuronate) lyase